MFALQRWDPAGSSGALQRKERDSPCQTRDGAPKAFPLGVACCSPDAALRGVRCAQGRGADLCGVGVVLAVPWTLDDALTPARAPQSPQLHAQHLQVLLVLRAGSPLLPQLLPEGLCRRKNSGRSGAPRRLKSALKSAQQSGRGSGGGGGRVATESFG